MKKLIISVSFLLAFACGFSQKFVPRGSSAITNEDARIKAQLNFYLPVATDTTLNGGLDSLGAMLMVIKNFDTSVYVRIPRPGGNKWVKMLKSGDPTGGVMTFNSRTGSVSLQSSDVSTALGYVPVRGNGTNLQYIAGDGSKITFPITTLTQGSHIHITGTFPNFTIAADSTGGSVNLDSLRDQTSITVVNPTGTSAKYNQSDSLTKAGPQSVVGKKKEQRTEVPISYAEMRALTTPAVQVHYSALINNQYSKFYWDATSTATDDSVTVIKATSVTTGRFLRYYENYVLANWFGFDPSNSSALNSFYLQKAINFAIANLKTPKVKVLGGLYNVKNVVIYKKTGPSEYDFVTCTIEGAAPTFDISVNAGPITVFNNADTASFILGVEKGRNCVIKDISFNGPNAISPTVPQVIEWTDAQWTNLNRNNRYSPSTLIAIDPFSVNVVSGDRYPGLSAWYTNSSSGGTSQVTIDGVALRSCINGITVSSNGSTQNCDNINLINSSASNLKNVWATCQTQSRNNSMNNIYTYGGIQYLINCVDYGGGVGSPPNIIKGNIAGGTKYLYNIGSAFSGMDITDSYIESIWSLGKSNILPVTFTNTQVSLMIPDATSTFTSPLLAEGSTVNFVGGTLEWFDNLYNVGFPFKVMSLNFNGTTLRGNMPINYVFDRSTYNGVRIFNGYADGTIWDKNVVNIDLSNEVHQPILPGTIITGSHGENYRSIEKSKVQQIFTENHVLTINSGSHTASFKSANPKKYQVNDALMTTTTVTYSNSIYSAASTSLGYVYSIGGDSTITLHYVPYGLSGATSYDINIYRIPLFIPRTIGNIVSGSDTIRNVVYETASFRVGDRIKSFDKNGVSSYGIVPGTYVKYIDLANGKIAISIAANQTASNIVFEDAHLYKEAKSSAPDLGDAALPQVWAPGDNIWNDHSVAANDSIALWQCVVAGKYTGTIPIFISLQSGSGGSYTLPTASTTVLGGVKIDGTTITITGGVISSTGGGGTPPTFYPESYGGVVNSPSTDNSVPINAAITAAHAAFLTTGLKQRVTLSAGTWWLRNSYRDTAIVNKPGGVVMLSGVLLQGAGIGATMVKASPPPAGATFDDETFVTNSKFRNVITATNSNDCGIMDLTVNGNIANQINYNINPYFSPQDGIAYDSCSDGIRVVNSNNITIENVKLDSITGYAVSIIGSPNSYVSHIQTGWNINGGSYFTGVSQGSKLVNSLIRYSSCDNVRIRSSFITLDGNEIAWSKANPDIAGANFAGVYIEQNAGSGWAPVTGVIINENDIHDNSSYAVDANNNDTTYYTYPGVSVRVTGNYMRRNANAGVQVQMPNMIIQHNSIEKNGADSLGWTDPVGTASIGVSLHGTHSNNVVIQNNYFFNNATQPFSVGSNSVGIVPILTFTENITKYGSATINTGVFGMAAAANIHGNSYTDSVGKVTVSDYYIDNDGAAHLKPNKQEIGATLMGQLYLHGTNDSYYFMTHANSGTRGAFIGDQYGVNGGTAGIGLTMDGRGDYTAPGETSGTPAVQSSIAFYDFQTGLKRGGISRLGDFVWGPNFSTSNFILDRNGMMYKTIYRSGSGTNQNVQLSAMSLADNLGLFTIQTPGTTTTTTTTTRVWMLPHGSVAASIMSQFALFNTYTDLSNFEALSIEAGGTDGYKINPISVGTGTLRDFRLQMNSTDKLIVRANGYLSFINLKKVTTAPKVLVRLDDSDSSIAQMDYSVGVSTSALTDSLNARFNQLDTTWHSRTFTSTTATTFNADTVTFTSVTANELIRITAEVQASKASTGDSYGATKTMFYNSVSGTITDGTGSTNEADQYIPTGGLTGYTFVITRTGGRIFIQVTSIAGTINGSVTYQVKRFKN